MAKVIEAPARKMRKRNDTSTQEAAKAAATMKPGQAIVVSSRQAASMLAATLRTFSGKPFLAYQGVDGKTYLTLEG